MEQKKRPWARRTTPKSKESNKKRRASPSKCHEVLVHATVTETHPPAEDLSDQVPPTPTHKTKTTTTTTTGEQNAPTTSRNKENKQRASTKQAGKTEEDKTKTETINDILAISSDEEYESDDATISQSETKEKWEKIRAKSNKAKKAPLKKSKTNKENMLTRQKRKADRNLTEGGPSLEEEHSTSTAPGKQKKGDPEADVFTLTKSAPGSRFDILANFTQMDELCLANFTSIVPETQGTQLQAEPPPLSANPEEEKEDSEEPQSMSILERRGAHQK